MTRNNIKIAITGGIGSGKSTVSEIIGNHGYSVFSCDKIYNELLSSGNLSEKISASFSGIIKDGNIDRKKLSEIVFKDASSLKKLNSITHPEIMKVAFEKLKNCEIGFCEVPLLFENGLEKQFDEVIVVLRDFNERIKSVMERSGLDLSAVKNRIKNQFNYDNYDFTEYYVIHNCSDLVDLERNTVRLLEKIKEKYSKNF